MAKLTLPVSKLVSPEGEILIPGVKELIAPVTQDEQDKFEKIHFEMADIHAAVGGDVTISEDTVKTVSGRGKECQPPWLPESTPKPSVIIVLTPRVSSWAACATPRSRSTVLRVPSRLPAPRPSSPRRSPASSRSVSSPTSASTTPPSACTSTSTKSSRSSARRTSARSSSPTVASPGL